MKIETIKINGEKYEIKIPKKIKNAFTCIDEELSVCSTELPKILDYINSLQQKIDTADKIINNCFTGEEIPIGDDYVYHEYYHYEPLEREEAIELLEILGGKDK